MFLKFLRSYSRHFEGKQLFLPALPLGIAGAEGTLPDAMILKLLRG